LLPALRSTRTDSRKRFTTRYEAKQCRLETLLTAWQFGPDVIIHDEKEGTGGYDFPGLEFALRGVFVKRKGKDGSVRVTGKGEVEIVVSGPRERDECVIITVQSGQSCGILGWPTYRLIIGQGEVN
jgi:hypothetical protein